MYGRRGIPERTGRHWSEVHEYVLVYAANPEIFKQTEIVFPLVKNKQKFIRILTMIAKGRWRAIPMTAQGYRPNQMYEITTPTGVVHKPPEGRCWSMIEGEFKNS